MDYYVIKALLRVTINIPVFRFARLKHTIPDTLGYYHHHHSPAAAPLDVASRLECCWVQLATCDEELGRW